MRTYRRLWLLLLALMFVVYGASAKLSRAAMITETHGAQNAGGQPLRTLQVLAEGVEANIPAGGKLRLVYLVSGQKESVSGPCRVRIGSAGSIRVSGTGQVVGEQSGGVKTKIQRSENIRRMGGALQATADIPAEGLLAMLADSAADSTAGARSTAFPDRLRLLNCPPVSASPSVYQSIHWASGAAPFRVTISSQGEELESVTVNERVLNLPERRFIPGKIYQIQIIGNAPGERLSQDFMVILPSERNAMESEIAHFSEALGAEPRDRFVAEISVQEEWGLLLDALNTCEQAVAEFPEDSGFQAALGRTFLNLGEYEKAREALSKAKTLDEVSE